MISVIALSLALFCAVSNPIGAIASPTSSHSNYRRTRVIVKTTETKTTLPTNMYTMYWGVVDLKGGVKGTGEVVKFRGAYDRFAILSFHSIWSLFVSFSNSPSLYKFIYPTCAKLTRKCLFLISLLLDPQNTTIQSIHGLGTTKTTTVTIRTVHYWVGTMRTDLLWNTSLGTLMSGISVRKKTWRRDMVVIYRSIIMKGGV